MNWQKMIFALCVLPILLWGAGCGGGSGNSADPSSSTTQTSTTSSHTTPWSTPSTSTTYTTTTSTTTTPTTSTTTTTPQSSNASTTSIVGFVNWGSQYTTSGHYTVTLLQNNVPIGAPVVTSGASNPPFTFTNVPVGSNYTIQCDDGTSNLTIVCPFTVPSGGLGSTEVDLLTRISSELDGDLAFVPLTSLPPTNGTATLVAYANPSDTTNPQIALDGGTPSTLSNPTWITGVTSGTHQVVFSPYELTPFTVNIPPNYVVVLRALYFRSPTDPQAQ